MGDEHESKVHAYLTWFDDNHNEERCILEQICCQFVVSLLSISCQFVVNLLISTMLRIYHRFLCIFRNRTYVLIFREHMSVCLEIEHMFSY